MTPKERIERIQAALQYIESEFVLDYEAGVIEACMWKEAFEALDDPGHWRKHPFEDERTRQEAAYLAERYRNLGNSRRGSVTNQS